MNDFRDQVVVLRDRIRLVLSGVVAAALGLLPHVLHHAGPLAGAALFAGVAGSLLFGVVGLALSVPLLLRVRRRRGSWRLSALLLALFAAVFSVSTFVVGPKISGGDEPSPIERDRPPGHEQHHR
jgi:hypothetical protein